MSLKFDALRAKLMTQLIYTDRFALINYFGKNNSNSFYMFLRFSIQNLIIREKKILKRAMIMLPSYHDLYDYQVN